MKNFKTENLKAALKIHSGRQALFAAQKHLSAMQLKLKTAVVSSAICLIFLCGCEKVQQVSQISPDTFPKTCIFIPHKIKFNQLTEITKPWQITAYVDLTDQFNSRFKAPGIWRFELYTKVERSGDPLGSRVYLSPDFDLTLPEVNNSFWEDYLRCYKFQLNIEKELSGGKTYILRAECLTAQGKRLEDAFEIKF